ncbi:Bug family tripartite tricarboxylate transporter substrate binding protein [Ramlibacter sp.]|uniref:Bug family tripartite tricarboxylate transporter substrate binding protein n=1 Tax=Ramlibacter sp. TaxID=1917967 RepID=UPI003D0A7692
MLTRRTFNLLPLLGAAPAAFAQSEPFPSRPIRLVAAYSPGSGTDAVARLVGTSMAKTLNGQVIVDNKVGAGGMIAADFVAKSAPDGYNLLFTTASHYALPFVQDKLPYDAFKDFAAVAAFAQAALIITVPADSPLRSVRDIVAEAKKRPGALTYSTSGVGTTVHMAGALFNSMAGTDIKAVHYKVAPQAILDASTGQVSMAMSGIGGTVGLIKAGKLRPIAVTSIRRSELMPDVPTVAESGLPNFEVVTPMFALARAGTPKPILDALSRSIVTAAGTPEFKALCTAQILEVAPVEEAALAASMPREFTKWKMLAELAQKQG